MLKYIDHLFQNGFEVSAYLRRKDCEGSFKTRGASCGYGANEALACGREHDLLFAPVDCTF